MWSISGQGARVSKGLKQMGRERDNNKGRGGERTAARVSALRNRLQRARKSAPHGWQTWSRWMPFSWQSTYYPK